MECFRFRSPGCGGSRRDRHLTIFKFEDLERATGFFSEDKLLGRGSYGSVYKAILPDGRAAAVKKATCSNANLLSCKELDILTKVACSHIVNLLGFCQRFDEVLLVVELMDNGSLHDVLHSPSNNNSGSSITWRLRIRFALQVAKAVSSLHAALPDQIIHRDIKSSNVLIDAQWNARLADFGLALRGNNTQDIMCTPAGTLGYFDPRYDKPERVGPKIDVFSFGVLLLEIISGRQVIDVKRSPMQMVDWALPLIKQGIKRMTVVAARCIRLATSKRPTMAQVVEELTEIKRGRPLNERRLRCLATTNNNNNSVGGTSTSCQNRLPPARNKMMNKTITAEVVCQNLDLLTSPVRLASPVVVKSSFF